MKTSAKYGWALGRVTWVKMA